MPITLKKPPLLPTLLTAASVVILVGLGTWQASRYNAKAEGRSGICAQDIAQIQSAQFNNFFANPQAACPNKLALSGYLLQHPIIPVGPRIHGEESGYNLYAPFKARDDDSLILVNLGWSSDKTPRWTQGFKADVPLTITGSLVPPKTKNIFTLENNPDMNEWFSIQPAEISTVYGLDLSPYTLHSAALEPQALENFNPAPLSKLYLTPETHLQYAAFWYCMGLALVIIYTLRFLIILPTKPNRDF